MDEIGACDSCGSEGVDVRPVHRAYVTPEAWDTEEKVEIVDATERWCYPCRSHYPHAEVS